MKVVLDIKDEANAIKFIDMVKKIDYNDVLIKVKDKKRVSSYLIIV